VPIRLLIRQPATGGNVGHAPQVTPPGSGSAPGSLGTGTNLLRRRTNVRCEWTGCHKWVYIKFTGLAAGLARVVPEVTETSRQS
jgi:hypothetical protein